MFFAVIQEGHSVYGVGRSETEAIIDACRLGTPAAIRAALVTHDDAAHGDVVLAPCTEALFNRVSHLGPEDSFRFTADGSVDLSAESFCC